MAESHRPQYSLKTAATAGNCNGQGRAYSCACDHLGNDFLGAHEKAESFVASISVVQFEVVVRCLFVLKYLKGHV